MAEMTQQNAPVTEAPAPAAPPARPSGTSNQKKKQRKKVRNTIIALVVLAVLAVGGFFLYRFLTAKEAVNSQIQTQPAQISSIQSMVQGSGNAKAKDTAAITLTQGGTVQEVFVTAGDTVTEGQPLYTIRSQAAEDEVTAAQEKVSNLQKDMADLHKALNNLTVRAPFAGKLIEVSEFETGSTVSSGASVATLVNDKKLKLSLYFSYAYENDIYVGQSVSVSIPAVMDSFTGSVEQVNKVHYITPEGADHFEVVVAFDNPGTLTEGMTASAALTAANGTPIYPYENGATKYYETRKIVTEAGGPLLSANLLCYSNVSAGQVLLSMGSDTIDSDIRAKQKEIDDAMEKLTEAQKALNNFNAVAPIDGTVTTCTLAEGAEVKSGDTVIIISNTTTMLVTITVDDRNISFIKPGDYVDLDWNGTTYQGVVTAIDMGKAESGSGMTNYPVTLTVENYDGSLMDGAWLQYSFVTSESSDCILVPTSAVKYVSDADGNRQAVVFVKRDARPDDVPELDLPQVEPGQQRQFPSEEDGFYPVIVTTGISDTENVEITSGVQEGDEVFVNFMVTDYSSGY